MNRIRQFSRSAQTLYALILALAGIITSVTTFISVAFGGGALALETAITQEQEAYANLAEAQVRCAPTVVEFICEKEQEICATDYLRNYTEAATLSGFQTATALVIHELTWNVPGPPEFPEKSLPDLENELRPVIEIAIQRNLEIDLDTVCESVEESGCFGGQHEYACLVKDLATAQVGRMALQKTPELVEKPEWWRDWLLGVGVGAGAMMIGGVLSTFIWSRISPGQAPRQ